MIFKLHTNVFIVSAVVIVALLGACQPKSRQPFQVASTQASDVVADVSPAAGAASLGIVAGAQQGTMSFGFDDNVSAADRRYIAEGAAMAAAYLHSHFGYQRDRPLAIFASADPYWLRDQVVAHVDDTLPVDFVARIANSTGQAGDNFIVVNTGREGVSAELAQRRLQRNHLLAHEMAHIMQHDFAGDRDSFLLTDPTNTTELFGPIWLIEGASEYIAYSMLVETMDPGAWHRFDEDRLVARAWSTNGAPVLSSMEAQRDWTPELKWPVARVAVQDLVMQSGIGSLPTFWRMLGSGMNWRSAFRQSFGRDVQQFYAQFDASMGR